MNLIGKHSKKDLVVGFLKIKYNNHKICDACQKGKQVKGSFKLKNVIFTSKPFQLLHIDLIDPLRIRNCGANYYMLVIIDH